MNIVVEDNKTIIHHKVAARAEQHQQHRQHAHATAQNQSSPPPTIPPSGPSGRPSKPNGTTSFLFAQDCRKIIYTILTLGGSLVRFILFLLIN